MARKKRFPTRMLGVAAVVAIVAVAAFFVARARRPDVSVVACRYDLGDASVPDDSETIVYAVRSADLRGWPVVRGEIAGCAVNVFLDTGVMRPILMPGVAERIGVKRTGNRGVPIDIGGRNGGEVMDEIVPIMVSLRGIHTDVPVDSVFMGKRVVPEQKGIAAIVPPQLAISPSLVPVLDFGRGTYTALSHDVASVRYAGAPSFEASTSPTCGSMLRVRGAVDGVAAWLELDTGSMATMVYSETPAGRAIAPRARDWHVDDHTGFEIRAETGIVDSAAFSIGALRGTLGAEVLRGSGLSGGPCGVDGVLGATFFVGARCVLVFTLADDVPGTTFKSGRVRAYCK